MNKFFKAVKNPKYAFLRLVTGNNFEWMDDEAYLKMIYRFRMGKSLNLDNPQTFNEKLQWLKLYDRKPEYTTMVDKYAAKKYVADIIGEEYIIPALGKWDHFDDIDFDKLPNQFVLKCNHDSGSVIVVKDKTNFDKIAAKKKLEDSLKHNYYWYSREWPYKNVKPCIFAEKYMEDSDTGELRDYKFFCFDGKVEYIMTVQGGHSDESKTVRRMHNCNWELLPIGLNGKTSVTNNDSRPVLLSRMIELAEILSKDLKYLRVDLYIVAGKIYFGELTFYHMGGFMKLVPEKWDLEFGTKIIVGGAGNG